MALLFGVCFSDSMFLSLAFFTPNSAALYGWDTYWFEAMF
jgi:hypothetical protein